MKRNTNRRRGAVPALPILLLLLAPAPAAAQTTVLTNVTVIDATGAPPIEDAAPSSSPIANG